MSIKYTMTAITGSCMKPESLSESMLKLMSGEDRRALKVQTAEEAQQAFTARNEKSLQQQIAALLKLRGVPFINPPMSKRSMLPVGWADFSIFLPGPRTVFLECKVGKNDLDPEQAKFRVSIMCCGFEHHVVRSLEEARDILTSSFG